MRRRTEDTKNSIIMAAHTRFLDQGYTATSLDDIASTANVAKQTIYSYFEDKRALFTAVVEYAVGTPWNIQTETRTPASADDLRHALRAMLTGINAVSMRPRYIKLLRVVVSEVPRQPELGDLFRNGVTHRALQALSKLFASAQDAGVISIDNPELAARFFLGGIVVRLFLDGLLAQKVIKKFTEAEIQEYVDTFVGYLQ